MTRWSFWPSYRNHVLLKKIQIQYSLDVHIHLDQSAPGDQNSVFTGFIFIICHQWISLVRLQSSTHWHISAPEVRVCNDFSPFMMHRQQGWCREFSPLVLWPVLDPFFDHDMFPPICHQYHDLVTNAHPSQISCPDCWPMSLFKGKSGSRKGVSCCYLCLLEIKICSQRRNCMWTCCSASQ